MLLKKISNKEETYFCGYSGAKLLWTTEIQKTVDVPNNIIDKLISYCTLKDSKSIYKKV